MTVVVIHGNRGHEARDVHPSRLAPWANDASPRAPIVRSGP